MKQSTNFPYYVDTSLSGLELKAQESDLENYSFLVNIPQVLFNTEGYDEVKDKINLLAESNCSATLFRQIIQSDELERIEIKIPKNSVFKTFTIDLLIVFNEATDWDGHRIEKGMPISHLGTYRVDIDNKSQGLISFTSNSDNSDVTYSYTSHQIQIIFPSLKFDWLLRNQNNPLVKNILRCQFAQIALIKACNLLKDESNDHLLWQKELKNKWIKYDKNGKEFPDNDDTIGFVNNILNHPSEQLIDFLMKNNIHE